MKVQINKYLRNIGINEKNYWVIAEDPGNDSRYKEDEEGFINAETWNLSTTLAMINYSYLCYFREHCMYAYPSNLTFEKWQEYIDKMIKAFELILKRDYYWDSSKSNEENIRVSKNVSKQIKFGLNLFVKYFEDLWW